MTEPQKDKWFVLAALHGGLQGGHQGSFLTKNQCFSRNTHLPPSFGAQLTGIISPPCPEVILDTLGRWRFGRTAAIFLALLAQSNPQQSQK